MGHRGDETGRKGEAWRDRHQADPARTIRALFLLRYLSVAVVAITSVFVGDFPAWTPFAVVLCGGGTTVVAHVGTRRRGHPPDWLPVVEVLSVLVFTPIAPAAVVPVALAMLVAVAITAATAGIRMALATTTVGAVGLGLEHAIFGLADGVVVLVAFAVSAVSVTAIVGRLVAMEGQVRERLNDVVDTVDAALCAREPVDHQVTFVNQRAITMLGWFEAEWLTPGFWPANIHPEDRDRVLGVVERSIALGIDHEVRYRFRSADGRWVHLHDRASVVVDSVGSPVSLQGMSLDVTDRVEIEKRMSRYADIVDAIDLAMVVLDVERGPDAAVRLSAANPAAGRLLNRELGALIGARITEVLPALSASRLERRLAVVAQQSSSLRVEVLGAYSKMSQKIPRFLDRLEGANQSSGRPSVSSSPARHKQTRISKERQAELVQAYRTGARTLALAAEFGIHRDTVHSILQRAGVGRKAGRTKMTRADAEEARRLHIAGTSMRALGRRFGVSDDTVKRHIKNLR